MKQVVVLGAGFGGLELVTRLSEEVPDEANVTLIDQADSFVFGFSKLDVMVGKQKMDEARLYYEDIVKPSVEFKQERVESIDPSTRRVVTTGGTYDADILVVALGADYDPGRTEGFEEGGYEFYSLAGVERVREMLPEFRGGRVVIAVLGPFYKCPPAPYEAALLLHDYLSERGCRDASTITVLTPLPSPIPVSREVSQGVLDGIRARGIDFWPDSKVPAIDPATQTAHLKDGRTIGYDLFLGIPRHRAPAVVEESGLAVDGWIPVDTRTFATRFPDVYAIGDVTSAPVPRAGVFAEGEAATLAEHLIARLRGEDADTSYAGAAACYMEVGGGLVARADVEFLTGPRPTGTWHPASLDIAREKESFAAIRRDRWFGAR